MVEQFKPEEYQTRVETVGEWKMCITSYRLGKEYVCVIDNVDPGAIIVRMNGPSSHEVESSAIEKAKERIGKTRTF